MEVNYVWGIEDKNYVECLPDVFFYCSIYHIRILYFIILIFILFKVIRAHNIHFQVFIW